jgi:hypothetical protein
LPPLFGSSRATARISSARRAPSLGLSGVAAIRSTTWSPSISSSVICGG